MPMPPPKASTEGVRDRQVTHEMAKIVRALQSQGPQLPEQLAVMVGAAYWEDGTFDRALAYALADGVVILTREGQLTAT